MQESVDFKELIGTMPGSVFAVDDSVQACVFAEAFFDVFLFFTLTLVFFLPLNGGSGTDLAYRIASAIGENLTGHRWAQVLNTFHRVREVQGPERPALGGLARPRDGGTGPE